MSRVNASPTPPNMHAVARRELEGPLFAAWGERMREQALVTSLEHAAARFGLPTVDDRAAWTALDPPTLNRFTRDAEAERGANWPGATASHYARFFRDGNRTQYEGQVAARQQRLTRAVVVAAHTDDAGWLDEVADGVIVLCEQSTWSWAAHDDAHDRYGRVLPNAAEPYLDLGAGEVVAQLAVTDHVLGARLDARWPGLRERIRREAAVRVFEPFLNRDDLWWLGYWREVNNWNPWIIGNVVTAAVLLVDDSMLRARIVARALESLDRFVARLPEDGTIDEGYSYWWNGACRLLECLDVLARVSNGELDAGGIPVVRETLRYPYRMQLGAGWYVNVADGAARSSGAEPWHVPFRWGHLLGDDQVVAHARAARVPGSAVIDASAGLPRVLHALADAGWRDAAPADPPLPGYVWLPSVQLFVRRECAGDPRGLALAVKGGHNDENHNHRDVGSFIVALDGRPMIVDIGKPTYTAQTFGPDRYENPVMRSAWHNTAAPFGREQGDGEEFTARLLAGPGEVPFSGASLPHGPANETNPQTSIRFELAGAYSLQPGSSWIRDATLDPATQRVIVSDAWNLIDDDPQPSCVHLVLAGEVTMERNVTRVRAPGAASALQIVARSAGSAANGAVGSELQPVVEQWQLDDPELIRAWGASLTRLTFTAPNAARGRLITTIGVER